MEELAIYTIEKVLRDQWCDTEKKLRIISNCFSLGLDINYDNSKALFLATTFFEYDIVAYLIDMGIDIHAENDKIAIDMFDFYHCCEYYDYPKNFEEDRNRDRLKIIDLILSLGASIDIYDNNFIEFMEFIDLDTIKLLVKYGYDVFYNNNMIFLNACYSRNYELIEYLVSIGLNLQESIKEYENELLEYSARYNYNDFLEFLLKNGGNPNHVCSENKSLFEKMIYWIDYDHCMMLFEYGADIRYCVDIYGCINGCINREMRDKYADKKKLEQIINLCVDYGLDPNLLDR